MTTLTTLPTLLKDRDSHGIQTLIPDDSSVAAATISAVNSRAPLPADAQIVEVVATDLCRFAFGDETVDATQGTRRIFNGTGVYRVPPNATHFAVTQVGTSSGL